MKGFNDFDAKDSVKKNIPMFFSVGFLIINLLVFALAIKEISTFCLIAALVFFIYIIVEFFSSKEGYVYILTRLLEALASLVVSFAVIFLFSKFWLLFLPIIEIAIVVVFYVLIYKKLDI